MKRINFSRRIFLNSFLMMVFLLAIIAFPLKSFSQLKSQLEQVEQPIFTPPDLSTELMQRYFSAENVTDAGLLGSSQLSITSRLFSDSNWYSESEIRRRKRKSLLWTTIPIGTGLILGVLSGGEVGVGTFWFGALIGPSLGYFGTGVGALSLQGWKGILIRGGLTFVGIPAALLATLLLAPDLVDSDQFLLVAWGMLALIGAHAIYDALSLPERFQAHAQSLGLASISVRPTMLVAANGKPAAGVGVQIKF